MDPRQEAAAQAASLVPFVLARATRSGSGLSGALLGVMKQAGAAGMRSTGALRTQFNAVDPRAITFAKTLGSRLITQVDESTREGIRELVAEGLAGARTVAETATLMQSMLGLTARMVQAVAELHAQSLDEGADAEEALRDAADYADELIAGRAEMISRTETMAAANAGLQEGWMQAIADGELPEGMMKILIPASDQDVCDDCLQAAEEDPVPVDEEIPGGDPPRHPLCRCSMGLVDNAETAAALDQMDDSELIAAAEHLPRALYSEDQPRDDNGRWTSGGVDSEKTYYHGSPIAGIEKFDSTYGAVKAWFTDDKKLATDYAKAKAGALGGKATIYTVKLKIDNPIELQHDMNDMVTYQQVRDSTGLDFKPGKYVDEVVDGYEQKYKLYQIVTEDSFVEAAKNAGYDGIVVREGGKNTYGAFYDHQISRTRGRNAIERALYSEDQPRDDNGRWSGGGATETSAGSPAMDTVKLRVEAVAGALKFDAGRINIVDKEPTPFEVGGQSFHEAGHYSPFDKMIEINARNNGGLIVNGEGIIAHEITHAMHDVVRTQVQKEAEQFSREVLHGDEFGKFMRANGYLREEPKLIKELSDRFPTMMAMRQFPGMSGAAVTEKDVAYAKRMIAEDGHTDYAEAYWAPKEVSTLNGGLHAVGETLAEVGRWTYYQREGYKGAFNKEPKPGWQRMYKAIEKHYHRLYVT